MAITAKGLIQLGFQDGVDFVLQDNSDGNGVFLIWKSGDAQPSQSDVEAAHIEWQKATGNQAYQISRRTEYPSIADQLDDIYHNGVDGWKTTIKVTKDKYPKE